MISQQKYKEQASAMRNGRLSYNEYNISPNRYAKQHAFPSSLSPTPSSSQYSADSGSSSPISRSPPVEIYDLDMLDDLLETSSSSSSLTSSVYNHNHNHHQHLQQQQHLQNNANKTVTAAANMNSNSSSSNNISRYQLNKNSNNNNYTRTNSNNSEKQVTSPRSSIATYSSFHSSSGSTSSYNDEAFTFQDFISSIINDNDVEWHKLIIQDLARLLELKFREFKKSVALLNSNKSAQIKNFITSTCISLDIESDLFTKIAQKILEMASEEPNGILGARIRMRIMCEGGKVHDMCQCFAYDSSTMATSEITVTIKEDVRSMKKLLQAFKLYANLSKYVSLHVDSNNFDIVKKRLY